jgi:hypothetical protein
MEAKEDVSLITGALPQLSVCLAGWLAGWLAGRLVSLLGPGVHLRLSLASYSCRISPALHLLLLCFVECSCRFTTSTHTVISGCWCAGDLLSVAARRKHFQSAGHRTATSFTTEHVWTFHLWQVRHLAAAEVNLQVACSILRVLLAYCMQLRYRV